MNHEHSRLQHQHREDESQQSQSAQLQAGEAGVVFNTVEELLRFDSSQNPAPEAVEDRVRESVAAEPKKSWLTRIFSRESGE